MTLGAVTEGAVESGVTVKETLFELSPAPFVTNTLFGSPGLEGLPVWLYVRAFPDPEMLQPEAAAGKVWLATPDCTSVDPFAVTWNWPLAALGRYQTTPPFSAAFVNEPYVSEGSLGALVSTFAVLLALDEPWLPTLSESSSRYR